VVVELVAFAWVELVIVVLDDGFVVLEAMTQVMLASIHPNDAI
jgi:hypothetical protein